MILGKRNRSFFAVLRRSENPRRVAPQLVAVVESYDAAIAQVEYRNKLLSDDAKFYAGIVHSHSR